MYPAQMGNLYNLCTKKVACRIAIQCDRSAVEKPELATLRQAAFAAMIVKNGMNFAPAAPLSASYKLKPFALLPRGGTPRERCSN